jgi:uncharacterized MAPEG superfamily protein
MFVVLRLAYVLMYVVDMAKTRSLVWIAALLVNIWILLAGFR